MKVNLLTPSLLQEDVTASHLSGAALLFHYYCHATPPAHMEHDQPASPNMAAMATENTNALVKCYFVV